uniref:Uncharacterized protein n=1 Tax=Rhizophagus irregularis (strain DAOM 181602 / DAOM 197198 / MUCL 43194) TaxID=747089 RepID=U9TPI1_RHIID
MEGVIKFQYLKAEKVSSKESGRVFRAENFAMQLSLKEVIRERRELNSKAQGLRIITIGAIVGWKLIYADLDNAFTWLLSISSA